MTKLGISALGALATAVATMAVATAESRHWAFVPPVRPDVPGGAGGASESANPIDRFIEARLESERVTASHAADAATWLRRVTFVLTGLPPTPAEIDAFVKDDSSPARVAAVERLLASPAYGEEMACEWLDVARYADSYGRHEDTEAYVWPWRDWVIRAFNDNLSYDQFIVWQTAGDLVPSPTRDQRVATAFNRLAQQSNESGSDEVEFRLDQVADRVRTNATAFLGLTLECAKCHDHKFDPISQREYWQVAAFFDNIDERGVYSQYCPLATPSPSLPLPDETQESAVASLREMLTASEAALEAMRPAAKGKFKAWVAAHGAPWITDSAGWATRLARWLGLKSAPSRWDPRPIARFALSDDSARKLPNLADPAKPGKIKRGMHSLTSPTGKGLRFMNDDGIEFPGIADFSRDDPFTFAIWLRPEMVQERAVLLSRSKAGTDDGRGYELLSESGRLAFALSYFFPGNEIRRRTQSPLPLEKWTHVAVTYDGSSHAGGLHIYLDGAEAAVDTLADSLTKDIVRNKDWGDKELDDVQLQIGFRLHDLGLRRCGLADFQIFDRALGATEVTLLLPDAKEPADDDWFEWYLAEKDDAWRKGLADVHERRRELTRLAISVPEIMVMRDLPAPRPCFVRERGDYRLPKEPVQPATPRSVLAFADDLPRNRLGFARWLTDPRNPLTARVEANRLWQKFFGRGLVATPEDFGTRGETPSHPELLDWLAVELRESGWDLKAMCRLIALSSTFARDSRPAEAAAATADPSNRLLSRGPSIRLTAEAVRDQALAVSGLLVADVGGPPVRPYLPDHLYKDSGLQQTYSQDHAAGLYRRSLYTFRRRTLPAPEMAAFDAPTHDYCVARRTLTTTPAQALVLLNAPQFVEAARVLAEDLVRRFPAPGAADGDRLTDAFRRLTGRAPIPAEAAVLTRWLGEERADFSAHPDRAAALLKSSGERAVDPSLPPVEVAATELLVRSLFGHEESLFLR